MLVVSLKQAQLFVTLKINKYAQKKVIMKAKQEKNNSKLEKF
jgi:hypothetical protein